jgi:LmbE family N-acetylglucosaminyl deacetylase
MKKTKKNKDTKKIASTKKEKDSKIVETKDVNLENNTNFVKQETSANQGNNIISDLNEKATNLIVKFVNHISKQRNKKPNDNNIIFFCAHNDDQLLGGGGTIRKYVNEGKNVYTFIFSFGETSHPHIKPKLVAKIRKKESIQASKILGDNIKYLGIEEGCFLKKITPENICEIIKEINPCKIFTHAPDDPHPDHQAVFKLTIEGSKEAKFKGDLYSFDIWNIFSIKTREFPKLLVDISDTYKYKSQAFKEHKSQLSTKITIGWSFYLKAIINGHNNHCKYAELFHKINADEYDFKEYLNNSNNIK